VKVFLTGASSGIGAALAREYARRGAQLALFARRTDALAALAQSLDPQPALYGGDVRDASALAAAAEDFISRFGTPDIVIANAGISRGTLTDHPEDNAVFKAILDTNVLGMMHTFQPFVSRMRDARAGTLVGIASVAGFRGLPGAGAYSASKAAAIRYLESLRVELRGSGVRVVTICPGFVDTPMTAGNPYPMPFRLGADEAARRIVRAVARQRAYYVMPWPMAWLGPLLTIVPRPLYDRVLARRKRKPRGGV
jgi:NAD(P)-dependent dehydrogenase (short-subunit alcohol dehydrogenase family)